MWQPGWPLGRGLRSVYAAIFGQKKGAQDGGIRAHQTKETQKKRCANSKVSSNLDQEGTSNYPEVRDEQQPGKATQHLLEQLGTHKKHLVELLRATLSSPTLSCLLACVGKECVTQV